MTKSIRGSLLVARVLVAALAGAIAGACSSAPERPPSLFSTLDTLPSPAGPGSGEPNLIGASDGRIYLTWLERAADSTHSLRMASFGGGNWSATHTIARGRRFFVNWADFPSLAVLGDGRLAAHWLVRSDTGRYSYDVHVAQSADGGTTWSSPLVPHRDRTPAEHGFASLWDAGLGLVGAAWLDGRKFAGADGKPKLKEMMLLHATVAADGALGAEQRLDERICDCCQTSAAMTSRGPVVVYRDRSPDEIRDMSIVRMVDGQWTAPATVSNDNWHVTFCPVNGPAVDAAGDQVAVAWFTGARDTARVQLAFSSDAGATFGAPIRIDDGGPVGRVDVALRPDGGALVSWVERSGGENTEVRVRRVSRDGTVGATAIVAASTVARASGFPRMVTVGDTAFFAWTVPGPQAVVRVARATLRGGQ